MYNIVYETSRQSRFDARYWMLVHWDDPEGWYGEGGGRRVQDGEHMYTCGRFMLIIWQNQYNIVKLKKIIIIKNFLMSKKIRHLTEEISRQSIEGETSFLLTSYNEVKRERDELKKTM